MEFLVIVSILLALIDLYQLHCLVMGSSSVLYQRRRLALLHLIEASSGAVHRSSPQASISHSRSSKAYKEAAVGQSWADASMVE